MSDWWKDPDFEFEKDIDLDVETELEFDTEIDFEKDFDADIDIDGDADVEGNIATLTGDAEAVGKDTLVEVDFSVLTVEDEFSGVALSVISAVG